MDSTGLWFEQRCLTAWFCAGIAGQHAERSVREELSETMRHRMSLSSPNTPLGSNTEVHAFTDADVFGTGVSAQSSPVLPPSAVVATPLGHVTPSAAAELPPRHRSSLSREVVLAPGTPHVNGTPHGNGTPQRASVVRDDGPRAGPLCASPQTGGGTVFAADDGACVAITMGGVAVLHKHY